MKLRNVGSSHVTLGEAGFQTSMSSRLQITQLLTEDCTGRPRTEGDLTISARECATLVVRAYSDVPDSIDNELLVPWSGSAGGTIRIPIHATWSAGADGGEP